MRSRMRSTKSAATTAPAPNALTMRPTRPSPPPSSWAIGGVRVLIGSVAKPIATIVPEQHHRATVGEHPPKPGADRAVAASRLAVEARSDPCHRREQRCEADGVDRERDRGVGLEQDDPGDGGPDSAGEVERDPVERDRTVEIAFCDQRRDQRLHRGDREGDPDPDHERAQIDRPRARQVVGAHDRCGDRDRQGADQGQRLPPDQHPAAVVAIGERPRPGLEQQRARPHAAAHRSNRHRRVGELEHDHRRGDVVDPIAAVGDQVAEEERPVHPVPEQRHRRSDLQPRLFEVEVALDAAHHLGRDQAARFASARSPPAGPRSPRCIKRW